MFLRFSLYFGQLFLYFIFIFDVLYSSTSFLFFSLFLYSPYLGFLAQLFVNFCLVFSILYVSLYFLLFPLFIYFVSMFGPFFGIFLSIFLYFLSACVNLIELINLITVIKLI